jgi:phosphoribosylamine--glycine ligase
VVKADGLRAPAKLVRGAGRSNEGHLPAVEHDVRMAASAHAGAEVRGGGVFSMARRPPSLRCAMARTAIALTAAQDHKRVGEADTGPNTGGMGAYSPAPVMTPQLIQRTMDEIVLPTVRAMKAMGAPFKGVLFAGLMITSSGPKLIEFNARFGDPETQVLMLRLMSDLLPAADCEPRRPA